jgi:hypothetical protein
MTNVNGRVVTLIGSDPVGHLITLLLDEELAR